MSRKSEIFFDAITQLREDLIEEAQNFKFHKKTAVWKKTASLAACVVLLLSVGMVAVIPRCGMGGGSSGSPDFASDAAAPQDAPQASENTAPPLLETGDSGSPGNAAEGSGGTVELYQFTAVVIEVRDEGLLVEPVGFDSHYQCLIPTTDLEVPAVTEGDWIAVTCTSNAVSTSQPPVIWGVQSIEKTTPGV